MVARTTQRARQLRKQTTDAERLLWQHLRGRQLQRCKFRRQYPIGPFIVDFVCLDHGLIVEVDGGQHTQAQAYDEQRSAYLASRGFRVMRYWNNQVLEETAEVVADILQHLSSPP